MIANNPDITWALKTWPMQMRYPHQKFTLITTNPSIIIYHRLICEVDLCGGYQSLCHRIQCINWLIFWGNNMFTIWWEFHRLDWTCVSCHSVSPWAVQAPHMNCLIRRAWNDALAIWWEYHWVDWTYMSSEWPCHHLSCHGIPYTNCFIIWAWDNLLAIWWEVHRRIPCVCPVMGPATTSPVVALHT